MSHPIVTVFPEYIAAYAQLEKEYDQIRPWPIIGFWRQMSNLRQRERLTKAYQVQMEKWKTIDQSAVLHGGTMLSSHFRGVTEDKHLFFYCPVGRIVSWSAGDYENKWCEFEHKYVELAA